MAVIVGSDPWRGLRRLLPWPGVLVMIVVLVRRLGLGQAGGA